ncbi:MAG: RloB family protein [Methanothrix sp.]|nr:RloB family protein [Methanothrix sp.]
MNRYGLKKRQRNTKKDVRFIIIICEGECTEPIYFKRFNSELRFSGVSIKTPPVPETNPVQLVRAAIHLKNRRDCRISLKEGDEIYCVYDVDDNTDKDLNIAFDLAKKNGIKVLLSNPCFEIWFLLHFLQVNTAYYREELFEKIKDYIADYEKSQEVYHLLRDRQQTAIDNAKNLNIFHEERGISLYCRASNPSTQVFELVEYIQSISKSSGRTS